MAMTPDAIPADAHADADGGTDSGADADADAGVHAPQPAAQRWLRALIGLVAVLAVVVFAMLALQSHRTHVAQAKERTLRHAAIAREHAHKMMRTNDVLLGRLADLLGERSDAQIRAEGWALRESMRRMTLGLPEVQALAVIDAAGDVLLTTAAYPTPPGVNVASREYFAVHRLARDAGLYLSGPTPALATPGELRLVASRARPPTVEDSFAGVLALGLRASVFDAFYRELLQGDAAASVSLFRQNGMIVSRMPAPPQPGMVAPASGPMMQRVAQGETEGLLDSVSPVDGQRRMVAFQQVEGYGLYVSATASHEAIDAAWRKDLLRLAAFIVPSALGLMALSWLALRHTHREHRATLRWRAETARRLKVEEALRQTQRLEALGHLTGGVAHDVNNLLMVVSNNAYLIRSVPRERDVTPQVDAILRAVATGSRLTRQLLAFARRQAVRPEVVDLSEMMTVMHDLMRHSVPTAVSVRVHVEPGTPCIRVDPAELELALINLAVNARDAMPEGGRLDIGARFVERADLPANVHVRTEAPRLVALTVADTGVGVPDALRELVFEPFFTTKPPGLGTGLGLSQVYGFATQAGGTVRLDSQVGRGTTVTLYLPCTDEAAEPAARAASAPAGFDGHVLLVDDHADVTSVMAALLEQMGARVTVCGTATEALAALDRPGPAVDVVLSDITMPGEMDGIELAVTLGRTRPRLPVVLMTGFAANLRKALSLGIEVIAKPCSADAVAAAIARALASQRVAA